MNKKGKRLKLTLLAALATFALAACTNEEDSGKTEPIKTPVAQTEQAQGDAKLTLDQSVFTAENWQSEGTHHKSITGSLLVDGKPVVGANVQVSEKRVATTDKKGQFSMTVDANIVERAIIHVKNVDDATVDGKPVSKKQKDALMKAQQELLVYYPIEIEKVEANPEDDTLVDVTARAVTKEGDQFPKFGVEKFPIIGTIKDADGNPVEGAIVNFRRDGVEGFTMSEPSEKNGEFAMFYIPEDDEAHYMNVFIAKTNTTYTLPNEKAFYFPDDYGVKLDITLPKEGTVIQDEPPTLVATSTTGALHKGVLIGVNADADYKITIPLRDGTFNVTLPKEEWKKNPTFYEVNYHGFHEKMLDVGETLTKKQLPLPASDEPSPIQATQH